MTFKLVAVYTPSKDLEAANKFYSALVGLESARSLTHKLEHFHIPLGGDGTWLWLSAPQNKDDNVAIAFFAVDDLEKAVKLALSHGGKVISEPMNLPIPPESKADYAAALKELKVTEPLTDNLGRFQLLHDPSGSAIGLIQIEPHSHIYYNIGKHATPSRPMQIEQHARSVELGKKLQKP